MDRSQPPQRKTKREIFLAACDPAAVDFFSWLLDEAKAHNFTITWGKTGFSVRVRLPGRMASFAYGYPADSFQAYLDKNLDLTAAEKTPGVRNFWPWAFFRRAGSTDFGLM